MPQACVFARGEARYYRLSVLISPRSGLGRRRSFLFRASEDEVELLATEDADLGSLPAAFDLPECR